MSYNIQTLLNDLSGVIHGTTGNKIPNVFGHINRAARTILLDVDPKETQRIVQMSQVFNDVYDYPIPVDIKGDRIIDLRPQAGRSPGDIFTQGYETAFDAFKGSSFANKIYSQWNTGVKTIRIEADTLTSPVPLTDTSSTTGWSVTSGASTLTLDTTNNVAGGGALVFNLVAGQSSGHIDNSTLNPIDYTNYLNNSSGFVWVYLPNGSAITSIDLRWGSDLLFNYYNYTATTTQQGTAFQNGWNLITFPWALASVTGSPDITKVIATRFTLNYNSTLQTGVKVCNLTFNQGFIFDIVYYSKYLFRNPTTNAFQETVVDVSTDSTTIVNLDTESYNLLFNKTAFYVAQALQGADADYDATFWTTEYDKALVRYKALNPSEAMLKGSTYYSVPNKRYGAGGGGNSMWFRGPNSQ